MTERIGTTHVGSLPRPAQMHAKKLKKQAISKDEIESYLTELLQRQVALGLWQVNNGELPRDDYVSSTVGRIAGFTGEGVAPIPEDMARLPEYARRFGGRNGLITLNPKAPVKLPACAGPLSYTGETSLHEELSMMVRAFDAIKSKYPGADAQLFFTAPSPGTIALFLENTYYRDDDAYLETLGQVLQKEYELIAGYGVLLQIDCPDLAMGRHTRFRQLDDEQFLSRIDKHVTVLNQALSNVAVDRCRVHICWGNYAGTHHCDIGLERIFDAVMRVAAMYVSLESSNHRHAHEWEVFERHAFPQDKILMPGVIDTTSNVVEHPKLVAQRLRNFAKILGPDRVIACTDCGFASTASATSVTGEVAWLKLESLVRGAELAAAAL